MKALVSIVCLAGCGFQSAVSPGTPDGMSAPSDARPDPDAAVVPLDARMCFGTGLVKDLCLTALPAGDVTLPGTANPLDTSLDGNCTQIAPQSSGPALCVIAGTQVTVTGALVAIGTRPLVLIATDAVIVNGSIDVSSTISPRRTGAGANSSDCTVAGAGKNDSGGAGGGAGGSFGTAGGNGGTGDLNTNGAPAGSAAGGAVGAAQATPKLVRGGCPGGAGGEGDNNDNTRQAGAPGDGGGAVYLIAGRAITVSGTGSIFASGAGGGATTGSAGIEQGGGGGGSGGMIVLDAQNLQVQGRLVANGGGGAGGGGNSSGGGTGGDGTTTSWNVRAAGGDRAESGVGNGAQGTAIGANNNFDGDRADGGGGGGAGGLGVIWTYGTLQGGTQISPAAVTH